jgi:peptide/nickel transport system substrate-binding protein
MGTARRFVILGLLVAAVAGLAAPVLAQDRVKTKEVVVGLGAEPRTMLAVTIVDWTTNNMLEHIYDRLLDRDAKTFKPKPMLATEWKIVNDTTWEFKLRRNVKFHNGEPFTGAWSRKSRSSTTTRCASSPSSRGRTWWTARRPTAPSSCRPRR